MQAAKMLLALNNTIKAKEVVLSGLLALPKDIQTLLIACRVLETTADFTDALDCAQRVIALYPKNWQGYFWAAKLNFSVGSYTTARQHVDFALSLQQDQPGLLLLSSKISRADNRSEDSLKQNLKLSRLEGHEWTGSIRVAEDFIAKRLFDDAQMIVRTANQNRFADYIPQEQAEQRKFELWRYSVETCAEHYKPNGAQYPDCLLYTSPSPRDATLSRMPSSA